MFEIKYRKTFGDKNYLFIFCFPIITILFGSFHLDSAVDNSQCPATIKFYYNKEDGLCTSFIYKGCKFNKNFFSTLEECETENIKDACSQPLIFGPCSGKLIRYHFNATSNECVPFIYGGCGGNQNKFISYADCAKTCKQKFCYLPKSRGPCRAVFPRYYFDSRLNHCRFFTYGGCKGNKNNFESFGECERSCSTTNESNQSSKQPLTTLIIPTIETFATIYTGLSEISTQILTSTPKFNELNNISPNKIDSTNEDSTMAMINQTMQNRPTNTIMLNLTENINSTLSSTLSSLRNESTSVSSKTYLSICNLPLNQGSCNDKNLTKYYFDTTLMECNEFIYRGCGGNDNHFNSKDECYNKCQKLLQPNVTAKLPQHKKRENI